MLNAALTNSWSQASCLEVLQVATILERIAVRWVGIAMFGLSNMQT